MKEFKLTKKAALSKVSKTTTVSENFSAKLTFFINVLFLEILLPKALENIILELFTS